jgi:hypothetical protein
VALTLLTGEQEARGLDVYLGKSGRIDYAKMCVYFQDIHALALSPRPPSQSKKAITKRTNENIPKPLLLIVVFVIADHENAGILMCFRPGASWPHVGTNGNCM